MIDGLVCCIGSSAQLTSAPTCPGILTESQPTRKAMAALSFSVFTFGFVQNGIWNSDPDPCTYLKTNFRIIKQFKKLFLKSSAVVIQNYLKFQAGFKRLKSLIFCFYKWVGSPSLLALKLFPVPSVGKNSIQLYPIPLFPLFICSFLSWFSPLLFDSCVGGLLQSQVNGSDMELELTLR